MRLNSIIVAMTLLIAPADADTLRLRQGEPLKGTLVSADSEQVVFLLEDGSEKAFPFDEVAGIDFERLRRRPEPLPEEGITIPVGTQIAVRMIDTIDGASASSGARFKASLDDAVAVGSVVAFPQGEDCLVEVVEVEQGKEMALRLVSISSRGKTYRLSTDIAEVEATGRGKASKSVRRGVGLGALGAGVGAIAGGGKGAALGAMIGGGAGAVSGAAAKGKQLSLPSETRLIFSLKAPVPVN
jgi:hypothetical protein